ncbi:6-phosphogluconolactonase [Rhodopirellula halodulae]|uniref:6-phosphogluconolactonase n=1 Tax=Rhodopirellula halodulae TaxID=2894198 RepID=UPI001E31BF07|nr:6-phosphogluconolactonase [Rhodopirellula sp. JC737]MCC9656982.1 6-phosphogluconolactonase [Rhodopirellula sp. JC737]
MPIFETLDDLSNSAADAFCKLATETIEQRGVFRVTLSGGSTPKRLYELLAKKELPWDKIEFYWGDERNVTADHSDSNYRMVREALLSHLPQESLRAFPVPVDPDNPAASAEAYEKTLRETFAGQDTPTWDLALLGMGDDAHTASLFPETEAISETDRWFVENWVAKMETYRYTLTAPAINSARNKWFLIGGANKRQALASVRSQASDLPVALFPSRLVESPEWFITRDAVFEA